MALNSGALPLSTTNLAAGMNAATAINPPTTRPSFQSGSLLGVNSESTAIGDNQKTELNIVTDAIKKSYTFFDPSTTPNGTNVLYNFRSTTWFQLNETIFSIPLQFTMTDAAGTVLSAANVIGILGAMNTAGYNFHMSCFDYCFNQPSCCWHQMFQTCQFRAGSTTTNCQSFSNDVYPNILTTGYIPKQETNNLNQVFNDNIATNTLNSRNGNSATVATTTPWAITEPTDKQVIQNQVLQQTYLTNCAPKIQDILLADILNSIITATPMEMVFPLKNFVSLFNVPDSVNFPPNFPFAAYINFNSSPFIIRSFGNLKIKAQVITNGAASNISYPRIAIPTQEYSAEGTANLNQKLLSSYINFNYFEGKNIPPSNAIIPAGSTTWMSQMSIASTKPTAYVIYPIIPNVTNSIVAGRENFPNSPFDGLYFTKISINIAGYEIVYMDRQISTNNYRFMTRDANDHMQDQINNSLMELSNRYLHASKGLLIGVPLYFIVDPSKYITQNMIGPPVGPITSQITCTFQEYLPATKTLGPTTQQYQMIVYEIMHMQAVVDPTLTLSLISPGAKLDGSAPRATQSLAQAVSLPR